MELLAGEAFTASADYYNRLHAIGKAKKFAKVMFEPLHDHPIIAECLLHEGILKMDLKEYELAQRSL